MPFVCRGATLAGLVLCFRLLLSTAVPQHARQETALKPGAASLAIDGVGNLHKQSSSGVVRSEKGALDKKVWNEGDAQYQSVHKELLRLKNIAEMARFRTSTCSYFHERQFNYTDEICGVKLFRISDVLDSYNVEQGFWAEQDSEHLWKSVLSTVQIGKDPRLNEVRLAFYKNEVDSLNEMTSLLKAFGLFEPAWVAASKAIDIGCGLGGTSNALARLGFEETVCVDQAQTFLKEANKSLLALQGQGEVVPNVAGKISFLQSAPDLLCSVAPNSVDFVHAVGTLQHMKPMLQVAYMEQLCDALRVGGCGYFEIPVKTGNAHLEGRCDLQAGKGADMHYSPKSEVVRHLQARGCRIILASEKEQIGRSGSNMQFVFDKP